MHHVDEGPGGGPTVLMLHGESTWSYLYRKMIPIARFLQEDRGEELARVVVELIAQS